VIIPCSTATLQSEATIALSLGIGGQVKDLQAYPELPDFRVSLLYGYA